MPESSDRPADRPPVAARRERSDTALAERLAEVDGLPPLVTEARAVWRARADSDTPGWRAFEDAFPTFYQFTNRPR